MLRLLYKKECEDCSTQAENEVLNELLDKLRKILQVPEKTDMLKHAGMIMKNQR